MMERLMSRGERLALEAQRRQVRRLADRLGGMVAGAAIDARETEVLVRGRGIIKRWLIDPRLRFLSGGAK